ncbi:hypothetical protein CC2G_001847 [Coprinopsis cinerea AmutBmut pab1-1]|nr:hypothetical protein CC2G_001847 [Coprinopsis cinerea AmutBmut pab1-1]
MESETEIHSQRPVDTPLARKLVIDVFGADNVGKTELCEGIFSGPPWLPNYAPAAWTAYDPTSEGIQRYFEVQGRPTELGNDAEPSEAEWLNLHLNLISSHEFVTVLERIPLYVNDDWNRNVIIVMYSVQSRESFDAIPQFHQRIIAALSKSRFPKNVSPSGKVYRKKMKQGSAKRPSAPIAIIGNCPFGRRQVSLEEAEALAQSLGCEFLGEVRAIRDGGQYSCSDGTFELILKLYRDVFYGDSDGEVSEQRSKEEEKGTNPMDNLKGICGCVIG